jgi:hypothetical protein
MRFYFLPAILLLMLAIGACAEQTTAIDWNRMRYADSSAYSGCHSLSECSEGHSGMNNRGGIHSHSKGR